MTTTTLSFVSLGAAIARLFTPGAPGGSSLMSLYRMVGSGDTVRPQAVDALSRMAK